MISDNAKRSHLYYIITLNYSKIIVRLLAGWFRINLPIESEFEIDYAEMAAPAVCGSWARARDARNMDVRQQHEY